MTKGILYSLYPIRLLKKIQKAPDLIYQPKQNTDDNTGTWASITTTGHAVNNLEGTWSQQWPTK